MEPESLGAALDAEREATARQINPLRVGGVAAFWLMSLVLVFALQQPAWREPLVVLSAYLVASLGVWLVGRKVSSLSRRFAFVLAGLDVPLIYFLQRSSFDSSTSAGAVAGFTIALYAGVVAVSALSLDVWQVGVVAVAATVFGVVLQTEAGISWGGRVATALVLGLVALASYLLFRRLIALMRRLLDDVAYRRKLQGQLEHADRMSTLGLLSASIAHEVGGPLTALTGHLELLGMLRERDKLSETDLTQGLNEALKAARRVTTVLLDIRGMARIDASTESVVDVHRVVETVGKLSRAEVSRRARLLFTLNATPKVSFSESRLSQVLLNLMLNAAQAIAPGQASTASVTVETHTTREGWAAISVKDTGQGIAPEHRERLFTPFFTTKPSGEGTGLGLTISAQLVRDAGGRIEVDSAVGKGTTFTVLLPPVDSPRVVRSGPSSWREPS